MSDSSLSPWSLPKRIGFRFLFSFLILTIFEPFGFFGQITGLGRIGGPWETLVKWTGREAFGVTITEMPAGSGDTTFNYVELACWVFITVMVTLVWSLLDRKRTGYDRLNEWLRAAVRAYLGLAMLVYGINKLVPVQFGSLRLSEMLQPIGEQSPMGMLWRFMAASPAYTSFTGFAEVLCAYLLFFRRTALAGALLCTGVMAHVVALNFCYDVPVKLFSSRLLLMSLFLLGPDVKRLWSFFILHRSVEERGFVPRFKTPVANATALVSKCVMLLLFTAMAALNGIPVMLSRTSTIPLQGIWEVSEFKLEDKVLPALTNDRQRWGHLVIEANQFPGSPERSVAVIFPMKEIANSRWMQCVVDTEKSTLTLTSFDKKKSSSSLRFVQPEPARLDLTGSFEGKAVEAKLRRIPESRFPLLSRGFHWINEYPFSR
jgi:hypothetical protein